MRVKLDEDLSHRLHELLGVHGHVTLTVRGQGWGGLKDHELWPRVQAEGVFFITADKDLATSELTHPAHTRAFFYCEPTRVCRASSGRCCRRS